MNNIVYITKIFSFEASHMLPCHKGKCKNLHGHSYKLHVTVKGPIDEATGMVIDFGDLKKIVEEAVVDIYDHSMLNDFFINPTAEMMVVSIFDKISELLPSNILVSVVKLFETENSYAEYKGESKK